MLDTRADSATALRRSRAPHPGAPFHHYIPAAELAPGDQIRDRGALQTIDHVEPSTSAYNCVTVHMTDGGRLGIYPGQHVHVWRP